ncbi:MAG: hypothetical protein JZU62_01980 [Sulfuricurvum sp.]|uniref:hypothetical protein n=1 Tax=Sulfuricurvum sp. TaxID=2025608 RepID=UPI0025FD053D|nr:hypothetical protein [Sulfuricurvum sp.]MBV5320429.1 hypothetical protein [Sulfuricurvum sp.]
MQFLTKLDGLLTHIKQVENETIDLTREAQLRFVQFIEKNNLHADDATIEAMQYQDIVSQQLSASIEAIESVQAYLQYFSKAFSEDDAIAMQSIQKMDDKLGNALEKAKAKHAAFSGRLGSNEENGIEFF